MSRAQDLLDLVGTMMNVMLVSERTPKTYQHAIPYSPLDFNTLGALRRDPGMRASALADQLGVAATTASSVIARLSKRGLVERRRSPKDGRAAALWLSEDGQRLADLIHAQDIRNMELFLSALTADEQTQLLALLGKVAGTVTALKDADID